MAGLILDSDALVALMNINDIHHKSIVKRLFQSPEGFSISVVTYSEALVHSFDTGNGGNIDLTEHHRISTAASINQNNTVARIVRSTGCCLRPQVLF